jgi:RNA polymerase sigma factor (sigma-70 family)
MASAQLDTVLRQIRGLAHPGRDDDGGDGELLERYVARRDEAAFVLLLRRHGPMVLGVCRRIQGNLHDAEDAFQATFLLLARNAGSIRKQESVGSWLHAVAQRLALAAREQGARRQARERRAADMRKTPEVPDRAWQELEATLDEALRQVPETYRAPLLLCYLQGKTQEEAARQLGCPLGTVRSRLARGRSRLKAVLERRGVRLSAAALAVAAAAGGATAAVPAPLLRATARAALEYGAGRAATALVSGRAATLVEGGLKAMTAANVRIATMIVLALGALGTGAGILASHVVAGPGEAPAQARPPAASAPAEGSTSPPAAAHSPAGIELRGRVLGGDSKPVAGAELFAPKPDRDETAPGNTVRMERVGAADANGRFQVRLSAPARRRSYLVAHAAGLGVDWLELVEDRLPDEVTFRLPKDVPITGRVVSTEGKPVAGASVSAVAVYVPANEKLDDYLAGWLRDLRDNLATPQKRLYVPLDGITGTVTTDRDGRFALHGTGAERIVHVTFAGGGIAQSTPYVITRPGFDPRPYNDVLLKKEHDDLRVLNRFLGLRGPSLTFVTEPGKTVEGTIRDAATGKPLPGCRVSALVGFGETVEAVSAADGRYRLAGLPKNTQGYGVRVSPPTGTAYLRRNVGAADTPGYAPVRIDAGLAQGVVVTGRVVDRQTGKGVSAGVRFAPLPDNRFFGSRPGFDNYRYDATMEGTDRDGHFRLVTIPGKALVMAQVHEGEQFHGEYLSPYRRAVPDPAHKDLFHPEPDMDSWVVSTAGGLEFLATEHAARVIDVRESGETVVELFVERGVVGHVTVQEADGKPLAGAWVAGLTDSWPVTYRLPEPTAPVYAVDPKKPRQLVVYHPGKHLGGTAVIRGDEKEPVVVKLGALGAVTGRLRDVDGIPLAGAEVSVNARGPVASELYRSARLTEKPALTDRDGRFRLEGIVPGVSFSVQVRKGDRYFGGKPRIGPLKLKPGGSRDLGDRTVEALP